MNEYLNVIRNNYADFSGRARRREYWMFTLINGIILILLEVFLLTSLAFGRNQGNTSPLFYLAALLLVVYLLAIVVPSLAVGVRRLHDVDMSGWFMLLNFVPGLSIVVLVLHILDSRPGTNKWGPNPKGVRAPSNAF